MEDEKRSVDKRVKNAQAQQRFRSRQRSLKTEQQAVYEKLHQELRIAHQERENLAMQNLFLMGLLKMRESIFQVLYRWATDSPPPVEMSSPCFQHNNAAAIQKISELTPLVRDLAALLLIQPCSKAVDSGPSSSSSSSAGPPPPPLQSLHSSELNNNGLNFFSISSEPSLAGTTTASTVPSSRQLVLDTECDSGSRMAGNLLLRKNTTTSVPPLSFSPPAIAAAVAAAGSRNCTMTEQQQHQQHSQLNLSLDPGLLVTIESLQDSDELVAVWSQVMNEVQMSLSKRETQGAAAVDEAMKKLSSVVLHMSQKMPALLVKAAHSRLPRTIEVAKSIAARLLSEKGARRNEGHNDEELRSLRKISRKYFRELDIAAVDMEFWLCEIKKHSISRECSLCASAEASLNFEKVVSKLLLAVRHDVSARKAMLAEILPTITTSAMASIHSSSLPYMPDTMAIVTQLQQLAREARTTTPLENR